MSAEADMRALLVASAPLVALVPAPRISLDMVDAETPTPYIVISKGDGAIDRGLDGTRFGELITFRLMCVGRDRRNAIAVADQLVATLEFAGAPPDSRSASYDADIGAEVEIVSLDWWTD